MWTILCGGTGMNARRLNTTGIQQFSEFLRETDTLPVGFVPTDLLTDIDTSESVYPTITIEPQAFSSKLVLAEYLDNQIGEEGAKRLGTDSGFWAWIALSFFEHVCPHKRGGRWNPSDQVRWIPAMDNWRRYYRHLFVLPWRVYRSFKDYPQIAMSLLYNNPGIHGETVEQIASRQELVSNRSVVSTATRLYFDDIVGKPKPGHGGKGAGSPRRFATILSQFDLTYDLYAMTTDQLIDLLPTEFDRFL